MRTYYKRKTKAARRQWWDRLTPEEKAKNIERWQAQKVARRQIERKTEVLTFEDQHLDSIKYEFKKGIEPTKRIENVN